MADLLLESLIVFSRTLWNQAKSYCPEMMSLVSVYMHLAAFTAEDEHAAWLRGQFISCHCCQQLDQKERCMCWFCTGLQKGLQSHAADLLLEMYTVQITSRNVNVIQTTGKLIRGEMQVANNASVAINH